MRGLVAARMTAPPLSNAFSALLDENAR